MFLQPPKKKKKEKRERNRKISLFFCGFVLLKNIDSAMMTLCCLDDGLFTAL